MSQIWGGDIPALTATAPEHCLNGCRLFRPGEVCHPGPYHTLLCPNRPNDLLTGAECDPLQPPGRWPPATA